jgi:hypothetical protein
LPNAFSNFCSIFFAVATLSGCTTVTVRYPHIPAGGALTESVGCVYDFDREAFWYVVFVHADGLLGAVHRHDPGIHLFVDHGDLLFYVRCSGRNEVIDLSGNLFKLSKGTVFLCTVEGANVHVEQLPIAAIPCDGADEESRARALAQLSTDVRVSKFLPPEARARLLADWKVEQGKKQATR